MGKRDEKNYGNVYEIQLLNGKYAYTCWIGECSFGIFNYISGTKAVINDLLAVGFKAYKVCRETAIKNKIWKLIGHIDLIAENIQWPDLAIFMPYNREHFIEKSTIMRHGSMYKVSSEYYMELLNKGYIYGFFDSYITFEKWIAELFED